jgi:hypothetical protein
MPAGKTAPAFDREQVRAVVAWPRRAAPTNGGFLPAAFMRGTRGMGGRGARTNFVTIGCDVGRLWAGRDILAAPSGRAAEALKIGAMVTEPIKPMTLSAKQRHALAVIAATGSDGATQTLLTTHGFNIRTIAALVKRGLVSIAREKVQTGRQVGRCRQGADHGCRA